MTNTNTRSTKQVLIKLLVDRGVYTMKLLFKDAYGNEREIAEVENTEEAFNKIEEFCKERDFTIWYTRMWEHDGRIFIDAGSWSEYFILDKC